MNKRRRAILRTIFLILIIAIAFFVLFNIKKLIDRSTETFMIENGALSFEEEAEGYIIRDEVVLQGENAQNGLSQIVTECTRVAKNEAVFRYYSNNEDDINNQIAEIDKQIDKALLENTEKKYSADINNLENNIKSELNLLYQENSLQAINEYKKKINNYAIKKGEIASENTDNEELKNLVATRNSLSEQLTSDSETIRAPYPGLVSYRVDGLEDTFKVNDGNFDYINKKFLEDLKLNSGSSIPESKESGKLVNNYVCYIACPISSENSEVAEVGNKVNIRLPDSTIVSAKIVQINEEKDGRVIIFEIKNNVENLMEYRKISFDIIWWQFSGWKVSNSALIEEGDLTYIIRNKAGIEEKIAVRVLRQNSTYSIVENYSDEELKEFGIQPNENGGYPKIKLYDEIKVQKNK